MINTSMLLPGDFVAPLPIGVNLTLQYGDSGLLESVIIGHDPETQIPGPVNLLHTLIEDELVPRHIPLEIGSTWVKGVLYTLTQRYTAPGSLPDCIQEDLIADVMENSDGFAFLAGHVESTAYSFQGATAARMWLASAHFGVLSGWLVPYDPSPAVMERLFNTSLLQFEYPLIAGYIIHRQSEFLSVSTGLTQLIVDSVDRQLLEDGSVVGIVTSEDDQQFQLDYSDILHFHIVSATLLIKDAEDNVVFAQLCGHDRPLPPLPPEIVCSGCGKTYKVPPKGKVHCDDPHCVTLLYPKVTHFLSSLDLPTLTYGSFLELVNDKKLQDVSDIWLLPEYADVELKVDLADYLRAIIPVTEVTDSRVFSALTTKCRNNLQTLRYYLDHPDKIKDELHLQEVSPVGTVQLIDWLSDPANLLLLNTLMNVDNVSFDATDTAFIGPAMFRNRKIMITGKFNRGPEDFVKAVLRSYSATVETHFSDDIDILLVGDRMENVNGTAIVSARAKGIPVVHEHEFFTKYDIDKDLAENL